MARSRRFLLVARRLSCTIAVAVTSPTPTPGSSPQPRSSDTTEGPKRPRIAFVTERQVGLRTYSDNLERFVADDPRVLASWHPVEYREGATALDRLPGIPESVRGAGRGRAEVRRAVRAAEADAHLFLTQTPVALGGRVARRRPYVIMVDDTPRLYDDMAAHYGETGADSGPVSAVKHLTNVRGLRGAYRVLPMSDWARRSLIDDYGVDDSRIEIVPTGIDLTEWTHRTAKANPRPRILFVGGDFERKGGDLLLEAFGRLAGPAELDIVTRSEVAAGDSVRVHHGLQANSAPLRELFAAADIFVLASRGEAFPNVVVEACASGLPAIVTDVGGMAEMVVDGVTGFVIPPDDVDALTARLDTLIANDSMRTTMAAAARLLAERRYDGRTNARRVVDLLIEAASSR